MNVLDVVQGSSEWLQARRGRVTASRVADAISFLKKGDRQGAETAARAAYKAEMVAEILSGSCSDHFVSPWMERGTAQEPFARAAYEIRFDVQVDQVGFVVHPSIDRFGSSPDGVMRGIKRGVEFKVPKVETHIRYMKAGVLPPEYEAQVMSNLACWPEFEQWDFVSFCPELPERHQIFRVPVQRDNARIAELESGVLQFLAEVDEMIAELDRLNPEIAATEKLREQLDSSLGVTDEDLPAWWFDDSAPEHAVKL